MTWIIAVALLVVIGFILDREIYFYEGVHLGPRVQAWLYDRWSRKYDAGKHESQLRDEEMLARPLLDMLKETPQPFILDFATGTGRLSFALLNQPDFKGHIVALDLSQGMLEQAVEKLSRAERSVLRLRASQESLSPPLRTNAATSQERSAALSLSKGRSARVEFIRHLALPLPFPDSTFDAVCALEVLELFPNMDEPLAELTRVLRPGGVLLTSRGTEESGRRAKVKSKSVFMAMLKQNGLRDIQITKWWKLFDRVLAVKHGSSNAVGARKLSTVLRCGTCGQIEWGKATSEHRPEFIEGWTCRHCGKELPVTKEGILLG